MQRGGHSRDNAHMTEGNPCGPPPLVISVEGRWGSAAHPAPASSVRAAPPFFQRRKNIASNAPEGCATRRRCRERGLRVDAKWIFASVAASAVLHADLERGGTRSLVEPRPVSGQVAEEVAGRLWQMTTAMIGLDVRIFDGTGHDDKGT